MRTRATTLISILAVVPLGLGTAAAQEQHPNPNVLLEQLQKANRQKIIEASLGSAREHATAGRKDEAIADYRKVLALEPGQPEALKALAGASALLPPLTLSPRSSGSTGTKSSLPPATGAGGGGLFGGGLY